MTSVLAIGAFGAAVAEHLRLFGPIELVDQAASDECDGADRSLGAVNVVASWRPVTELCDTYDRLSRRRGQPFIPVVLDGRTLTVGPVLLPDGAACWSCWMRREQQHAAGPNPRAALHEAYSLDPSLGPQGFLDAFALMAAATTAHAIDSIAANADLAGWLWQLDLPTRAMSTGRVIGCDGCTRCGLNRPPALRTVEDMQRSVDYLWTT
jgi:bacteriocin biosynthesis cyclodehydratase domain-containing protein